MMTGGLATSRGILDFSRPTTSRLMLRFLGDYIYRLTGPTSK